MDIGIRVPIQGRPQDTAAFATRIEDAGLDFMWMPDTPLLAGRWRDTYAHLICSALTTSKIRLGPGVTNPLTRHPVVTASSIITLDETSDGRADLVAGTGYSSAYIIGKKAATRKSMKEATELWRSIFQGKPTQLGGLEIELDVPRPKLPIYLAASGPKMLELAGEIADGVLIMVGTAPGTISWALQHIEIGMQRAGRKREDVRRMLVATTMIDDDKARAIEEMRPCAAGLFKNANARTYMETAGLEPPAEAPPIPNVYPDLGHAVDWEEAKRATAFVPDEVVERVILVGSAQEVADRVQEIAALDLDAVWFRDEASYTRPESLLKGLCDGVLPLLK